MTLMLPVGLFWGIPLLGIRAGKVLYMHQILHLCVFWSGAHTAMRQLVLGCE